MKMKSVLKAAAPALTAAGAVAFLVAPGRATSAQKAPFVDRNYAHRGLHKQDKSVPENSLGAFRAAVEYGYGVEMDVHLSADGALVVFHDDTLERICGVPGSIEDKTLAELRQLRLCGTEYGIPTLEEVLDVLGGRVPLILEIKRGSRNRELCEKTYAVLCSYAGPVCIESFDPLIVRWFRRNAPELLRGQLSLPPKDYGGSTTKLNAFLAGNLLTNVLCRPQFIAYQIGEKPLTVRLCERMGAVRAAWTSRAWDQEDKNDMVIFEHYRPGVWFRSK